MSKIGELLIYGLASGKLLKVIEIQPQQLKETLMSVLQKNNIPVASSCGGDGVCKKCQVIIADDVVISCQILLKNLFETESSYMLKFSYL